MSGRRSRRAPWPASGKSRTASASSSAVNKYEEPENGHSLKVLKVDEKTQTARRDAFEKRKAARSQAPVDKALSGLRATASKDENLFPAVLDCVKGRCHPGRDLRRPRRALRPSRRRKTPLMKAMLAPVASGIFVAALLYGLLCAAERRLPESKDPWLDAFIAEGMKAEGPHDLDRASEPSPGERPPAQVRGPGLRRNAGPNYLVQNTSVQWSGCPRRPCSRGL